MIKWIGQHIWDFISRFRNDVYLESVADPGSDTDKFLVIDANNKVGYRTGTEVLSDIGASSESTDLEFNGSTANGILTYGGAAQIDVEALFTYTPDDLVMTGTGSGKPTFSMVNANADAEAPSVTLTKQSAGNSSNGDDIGEITFSAYNSNNEVTVFAKILAEIESVTDTDEAGKLSLLVQAYDGTWNNSLPAHQGRNAFTAIGHGTNDIVSTTIGYGAASTTTIAGNLNANGEDHAFTSATNSKPSVTISSGGTSQGGGHINFKRTATGANNQNLGDIYFIGNNDADEEIYYAYINGDIQDASDGSEEGALYFGVASHDGELKVGLNIVSGNIEDEVDATIGNGTNSLVTVPGKLSIGTRIDFDSTGITGIQTAAESFSDDDVSLMTSAAIDDRINAAGGGSSVTADPFSTTVIKILPHQFMINDDAGRPAMIEDDTSNTLGVRCAHTIDEMYAFQKLPNGYKATHVQVHASASTSSAVTARSYNYQTGADNTISSTTGDFNANIDITDIPAHATTDLVIKVAPASSSTIIYGATVTIATI